MTPNFSSVKNANVSQGRSLAVRSAGRGFGTARAPPDEPPEVVARPSQDGSNDSAAMVSQIVPAHPMFGLYSADGSTAACLRKLAHDFGGCSSRSHLSAGLGGMQSYEAVRIRRADTSAEAGNNGEVRRTTLRMTLAASSSRVLG